MSLLGPKALRQGNRLLTVVRNTGLVSSCKKLIKTSVMNGYVWILLLTPLFRNINIEY